MQEELHLLKMKADNTDGQIRMCTQEVNEFIFALEKYANSQALLTETTKETIDKYKLN